MIEVYQYLDDNYDLEKVENIFVLGDGANWIKNAPEWITGGNINVRWVPFK